MVDKSMCFTWTHRGILGHNGFPNKNAIDNLIWAYSIVRKRCVLILPLPLLQFCFKEQCFEADCGLCPKGNLSKVELLEDDF